MNKIKCKYIFENNYNPIYVNGAQGGINPLGEIVINFFLERNAIPVSQTFEIKDSKIGIEDIDSEPSDLKNSFVRVIKNGVIINYQTAKELHQWLGGHIDKLEELSDGKK
ncbi:MAG: hypothetical protein B6I20_05065 [Bacteroidetes bacterium 4572_117]|nr:MAG: hypothetical protein B6I20_05065 [Bacteroidetes bacterium 4572_117]